ncbi:MAG: 8-oxo-dGTP diphosphatase [Terrimesophilobacter sp.]
MALPEVCVCYFIRGEAESEEVLLGRKKKGFGLGTMVAPGGKLEPGESPLDAAVRETMEEVGLTVQPDAFIPIGELCYPFPHRPEFSQKSWAFLCRQWSGEPVESNELAPKWFPIGELPLAEMWDDAKHWLPRALAGTFIRATFTFAADARSVEAMAFD